jgi:hypothetical protein
MRRTVSGAAEPRMSAGDERKLAAAVFAGAIIIARVSAVAYRMHTYNLSSRPRFALGPFSFENRCYGRLSRRRRVGSLLDECLLDAVANLGVHRTPRRLCGGLNPAAQLVIKADIEPRWPLSIVRMHGHPIQCRSGTLGYDRIT